MKHAKKLLLAALVVSSLAIGCTQKPSENADRKPDENTKLQVTTTIFPPYDFTREIAGDLVNLKMLLPPASESHSYEPTPRDMIALQKSDIFIYVGGESDDWVERVLASIDTSNMTLIRLIEAVHPLKEESVEGMQAEAEEGEDEAFDEHIWTAPQNTIAIVRAIAAALAQKDSANAKSYYGQAASYIGRLEELHQSFVSVTENAARRTVIFADRFPFRYLADAYKLSYFAAFPGCSTETEPSAATVAFLIDKIRAEKIPVVFHIELSNERMADTIAEATGAKKLLLHACHNVSKNDFESGVRCIDLQRQNVENLREALR